MGEIEKWLGVLVVLVVDIFSDFDSSERRIQMFNNCVFIKLLTLFCISKSFHLTEQSVFQVG